MSPATTSGVTLLALFLALPARTVSLSPALSEGHSRGPSLSVRFRPARTTPLFFATDESVDERERRLLEELTELTESFEAVDRTIKTNAELYQEAIETFQSKIDDLEEKVRASEESIAEKVDTIKELESSRDDLAQEAGTKVSEYQSKIDGLEKKLQASEEMVAEKELTIKDLEASNSELAEQLQSTEESGKEVVEMIEEEAGVVSVLEEEMDNLQRELAAKDKELSEWSAERESLLKERDDLKVKVRLLQGEIQGEAALVRTDATKKYIYARAEELKEREEIRKQAEVAANRATSKMRVMQDKLEVYESERNSLRKLSGLAWRRLKFKMGSVFRRKKRE